MRAWIISCAAITVTVIVVGCAMFGTGKPPTEQCWIAIRSYSAMLEVATEWYEDNPAGPDERRALRSVIEGARPMRQSCESLASACEAWAATSGNPVAECPQATKIAATAGSLTGLVNAANIITEEWSHDRQ